jgi:hypothetical protein
VKYTAIALAALALAACGSKKPDAYTKANASLITGVPVYPGVRDPQTSISGAGDTKFVVVDWRLPRGADSESIVDWYVGRLQRAGWKVTDKNPGTIRAGRNGATLSVGVRGRTLEVIANARGA